MKDEKVCDWCGNTFHSLHSTVIVGYGKREEYQVCTKCAKYLKQQLGDLENER